MVNAIITAAFAIGITGFPIRQTYKLGFRFTGKIGPVTAHPVWTIVVNFTAVGTGTANVIFRSWNMPAMSAQAGPAIQFQVTGMAIYIFGQTFLERTIITVYAIAIFLTIGGAFRATAITLIAGTIY